MNVIPKPVSSADMAARIAEKARAQRAESAKKALKVPTGSAWALACKTNPKHVGILFAEGIDPRRNLVIEPGMWFSSYKAIEEPFMKGRAQLVCGDCLASTGERQPLKVEIVDGPENAGTCFRVPAYWHRFVHLVNVSDLLGGVEVKEHAPAKPEPRVGPTMAARVAMEAEKRAALAPKPPAAPAKPSLSMAERVAAASHVPPEPKKH